MSINEVLAPMPALVVKVVVNEGDSVKVGDIIALLTIMKVETEVKTNVGGLVKEIKVKPEEIVDAGTVLITIERDNI